MIGQTLSNRYEIRARLGKGAMGTVYRATDIQSQREVALKVISSDLIADTDMLERFKREGEALSKLKHPNIVEFIDAFQHDEHYVIVMEYVSGGSLHDLISKGPLPINRANQIALELCDALIRSHHLNIIHRDLKPENVLLGEDGTPKLADFGVARLGEGTRMTRSGTQVGTPYYMSPEAWEGKELDAQADIWSLGVILFEMLAGQVPFGGDTGAAVMNKVLTAPPPYLKRLRSDVPVSLVKIVGRMLTRDKKRRYQTMRQVAVDLESGQQSTTPKPGRVASVNSAWVFRLGIFLILGVVITGIAVAINFRSPLSNVGATELPTTEVSVFESPVTDPTVAEPSVTESTIAYEGMKVEATNCDYGGNLRSIEAIDEFTAKITLCNPDPAIPAKVASTFLGIQSSEYLQSTGGTGDLLIKPVGTGPYRLESWDRGNQITFTRNDAYWGEAAKSTTVVLKWATDATRRLLELQSGTVDGIDNVDPNDFATVEGDSNLQLVSRPSVNIMYIGIANTFPPFDNELVRQAFAQAIDRERIVARFYPAGSEVATHFTPCSIPNSCAGEEWYTFNVDAARALLTQAGYNENNPFPTVKLSYRDVVRVYLPDPNIVAQDIQTQLKENLGVTVEINVMESGKFIDSIVSNQLEGLHLLGWSVDFPDVINFLDSHFALGASVPIGTPFDDITGYLAQGSQLADPARRAPFYEAANNAIKQHVPMIPVAHVGSAISYKATVEGAHANPLNVEFFAVMGIPGQDTLVFMQHDEPVSLYCADETDGESLRACRQVNEALLSYELDGTATETGGLAESYESNDDLTEWTFHLRRGVKFHDGSSLDANDVVLSYAVQWDASHPLHKGNTGTFGYWTLLFGAFLNAPAQ